MVFDTRARSNAVVVGGNTVRRDDPRLTTRREGGHQPTRIVMTQKLDLPEVAGLPARLCTRSCRYAIGCQQSPWPLRL